MCACVVVTVLMCVGALLGGSYGSDKANPKPAGDRVVCFMALSKEIRSRPKLQAAAVHKLTRAGTATTKRKFSGLVWALAACGTDMAQAGLAALLDGLSAELVRLALWESSGEEFSEAGGAGPTKEWIDARIGQETRMISIVLRSLVQLTRPSRILWEALARTWTTFAQFTSSEILRVRDEVGDCVSNDNAGLPPHLASQSHLSCCRGAELAYAWRRWAQGPRWKPHVSRSIPVDPGGVCRRDATGE